MGYEHWDFFSPSYHYFTDSYITLPFGTFGISGKNWSKNSFTDFDKLVISISCKINLFPLKMFWTHCFYFHFFYSTAVWMQCLAHDTCMFYCSTIFPFLLFTSNFQHRIFIIFEEFHKMFSNHSCFLFLTSPPSHTYACPTPKTERKKTTKSNLEPGQTPLKENLALPYHLSRCHQL